MRRLSNVHRFDIEILVKQHIIESNALIKYPLEVNNCKSRASLLDTI